MQDFKNKIMEQIKEILLDEIDESYQEEVLSGYMQSLDRQFKGLNVRPEFYDEALNDEVSTRSEILRGMSATQKLSSYVEDKAYQQLLSISNKGLEYAEERYTTGAIQKRSLCEKSKNAMRELLSSVKQFNKISAESYYNDGVLDFNYACGDDEIFSLRLSPYKDIGEVR